MTKRAYCLTIVESEDNKRFSFDQFPHGYHPPLVNIYRSIPSRKFDPHTKQWDFATEHRDMLLKRIEHLRPDVIFSEESSYTNTEIGFHKPICMFVLSTIDSFEVISSYDLALNTIFKTMSSRAYNAQNKTWSFQIQEHDQLVTALNNAKTNYTVTPIPAWILKFLEKNKRNISCDYDQICSQRLHEQLLSKLLPFQRTALHSALMNNGRLLLADDMGLGKTLQALCMALLYKTEWPLLIIVPASVKYTWQEQILKWIPDILVDEIHIIDTNRDSISIYNNYLITIVSYDSLAKQSFRSRLLNFKVIIADESHQLKNVRTVRCKYVMPLLKQAKRLFLLSGTPALSRPVELYGQLHCLYPQIFRNLHDFGKRYCGAKQNAWGWDYSGSTNITELQTILDCGLMVRREKQTVLEDLPNKLREIIVLDATAVKTGKSSLLEASKKILNARPKDKHSLLINYFHETALAKMEAVAGFLSNKIDWNKKNVIFAHHQAMLDRICSLCESLAVEYIRIDGHVNTKHRQDLVDQFQTKDRVKIAVLAIVTAGTGLNLTAASRVIFAELFWNPGILLQAEDRAYRLGSKENVLIQYLLAKETSDDIVWPLVQHKLQVLSGVGLSSKDALKTDKYAHQDSYNEMCVPKRMYHLIDEFISKQLVTVEDNEEMEDDELLQIANSLDH